MNINGAQLRAARALRNLTMRDLAAASGVSLATVMRAEAVDGPPSITRPNLAALQTALEAAGVEFIPPNGGGPGVRLRSLT